LQKREKNKLFKKNTRFLLSIAVGGLDCSSTPSPFAFYFLYSVEVELATPVGGDSFLQPSKLSLLG